MIVEDLNAAQREAVMHGEGPLMVLAGAGSGKTRVITRRVARLINDGVPASSILAVTFTNKAAAEMARRVEDLVYERVHVSTFHSACARFLRRDAELLGFPKNYSIYDTYDRDACIKKLMVDRGVDLKKIKPSQVGRRISQLKNAAMTPDDVVVGFSDVDQVVDAVFRPYQEYLRQVGAMDFDDLMLHFVALLREHPEARQRYHDRFQWILVDEFQDTNRVQYDLIKRLVGPSHNVCVVGDPDQSIYSFRGAEIRNILDFENDYPATRIVRLETNYRSTKCILRAAQGVIENNVERKPKELRTDNPEGDRIVVERFYGASQEARAVAGNVRALLDAGESPRQIAVFYRSHFLSRGVEEGFKSFGIPYEVVGGVSFFERREIKDLIAYLRVVVNPIDDLSMERIINVPPRGVGKVTLDKLRSLAAAEQLAISEAIGEPSIRDRLSKRARSELAELSELIDELRALAERGAHAVLSRLVDQIGYLDWIGDTGDPEDLARIENAQELHTDAMQFDREVGGGLAAYLQHVSLLTAEDRGADEPRVSLMTVHAAKGLEFDYVFVVGLEEDLFPHVLSIDEPGDFEEERRLMYVALTRARKRLWLASCQSRMVQGRLERRMKSSFLREIPADCVATPSGDDFGDEWVDGGDFVGEQVDLDDYELDDYSQDEPELCAGLRVVHPEYGPGTVLAVSGSGISGKATVEFDRSGTRTLLLEYAGLQLATDGGVG